VDIVYRSAHEDLSCVPGLKDHEGKAVRERPTEY
jgi:hypothetical protein